MSSDAVAISGSTVAADAVEANIGNLDDAVSDAVAAPAAALASYDPPTKAELDSAVAPLALEATAQDILTDTAEIGAAGAGLTVLATATNLATVDSVVDAIKLKTDNLPEGVKTNTGLNNFSFFMADETDHVTGLTGLTITAERSIDGGSFAACANSASEIGSGFYKINLAAADLNGTIVILKFTATGADATAVTIKTAA